MSQTKEYTVQKIVGMRKANGKTEYKVKWLGFKKEQDMTWEPESHLAKCSELIREYEQSCDKNHKAFRTEPKIQTARMSNKQRNDSQDKRIGQKYSEFEDKEIYQDNEDNEAQEYNLKTAKKQSLIKSAPRDNFDAISKQKIAKRRTPISIEQDQDIEEANEQTQVEDLNHLCTGSKGKYEIYGVYREKQDKNNFIFKVRFGNQEMRLSKEKLAQQDPFSLLRFYEEHICFIDKKK